MNKEELRIGNIVNAECYNSGTIEKHIVKEIFSDSVMITIDKRFLFEDSDLHRIMEGSSSEYKLSDIQPIPLTKEILLKCGYCKIGLGNACVCIKAAYDCKISISLMNDSVIEVYIEDKSGDVITLYEARPQYLHQLQNLYFDLTGKELEFNFNSNRFN